MVLNSMIKLTDTDKENLELYPINKWRPLNMDRVIEMIDRPFVRIGKCIYESCECEIRGSMLFVDNEYVGCLDEAHFLTWEDLCTSKQS